MNCNNFGGIDEILKYLGYEKIPEDEMEENNTNNNSKNNYNCNNNIPKYTATINPSGESDGNACAFVNLDIPAGFQDMNPLVLVTIGEIIGDVLSGQLPFNVANAVSNWFNLVGQIIETYAAQQTYFQSGPGRYYNPLYKNVSNPFCTSSQVNQDSDTSSELDNNSNNNEVSKDNNSIENQDNNNNQEKNCNSSSSNQEDNTRAVDTTSSENNNESELCNNEKSSNDSQEPSKNSVDGNNNKTDESNNSQIDPIKLYEEIESLKKQFQTLNNKFNNLRRRVYKIENNK